MHLFKNLTKRVGMAVQGIRAYRCGLSIKDKIKLVYYYFVLRIFRKFGVINLSKPVKISIEYNRISFGYYISSLDDYRILEEIFIDKQYELNADIPIRTILDIGSNTGASIRFFHAEYPDAHIYGFEPTKYCYDILSKVTNGLGAVTIEKKAVDVESGKDVPIYIHPYGHSGSSNFFIENSEVEIVKTISLEEVIEKYNLDSIDILKIDIEGLEYKILENFKDLKIVKYLFLEIHPFLSKKSLEEYLNTLQDFEIISIEKNPYTSKTLLIRLVNNNITT